MKVDLRRQLGIGHNRLAFADVLRFIAASAVLLQHAFEASRLSGLFQFVVLFGPGVFGVALFFFISGFVIPFSVRRGLRVRDFAIRRIFRIYPLVIAAYLSWYLLSYFHVIIDHRAEQATWADVLPNLFFYNQFSNALVFLGVTWTLLLELTWYGIFAFTLLIFRSAAGVVLEVGCPVLMALLFLASFVTEQRVPFGYFTLIYAAATGYQAFLYFDGDRSARRFWTSAVVFFSLMVAGNLLTYGYFSHPEIALVSSIVPWTLATSLFFALQVPRVRQLSLFRSRTLAALGTVSFSTYLLHPIVMNFVATICPDGVGLVLASYVLTLAVSLPSYLLIEKPGVDLGRRVARAITRKSDGSATVLEPTDVSTTFSRESTAF